MGKIQTSWPQVIANEISLEGEGAGWKRWSPFINIFYKCMSNNHKLWDRWRWLKASQYMKEFRFLLVAQGGRWKGVRTLRRDLLLAEAHSGACERALFFPGFLFFLHESGAQAFQIFQSQPSVLHAYLVAYHIPAILLSLPVFPSAWAAIQPTGQRRKGVIQSWSVNTLWMEEKWKECGYREKVERGVSSTSRWG